jgi:YD repeat-containing protein
MKKLFFCLIFFFSLSANAQVFGWYAGGQGKETAAVSQEKACTLFAAYLSKTRGKNYSFDHLKPIYEGSKFNFCMMTVPDITQPSGILTFGPGTTAALCSDSVPLWFPHDGVCAGWVEVPVIRPPCDNCKGGPKFGEPINPGTAAMWHIERDYVDASALGELTFVRTYTNSPYSINAKIAGLFGVGWSTSFDAVLRAEPLPSSDNPYGRCFHRFTPRHTVDYVWCESYRIGSTTPTLNSVPAAISITRGDGRKFIFTGNGSSWVSWADVNDSVRAIFSDDKLRVVQWIYTSAQNDSTETFDIKGRLISISQRSGPKVSLTYSNGLTNDTRVSRSPANAPICSHVQAGASLVEGRLLCVTDQKGRQLQFEYDALGRVTKLIDPAGHETLYSYDGVSAGCLTAGDETNRACGANNLTKVTYPDTKARTYFYNETSHIVSTGGFNYEVRR